MTTDKMVRMANQIATFFASQPGQDPAAEIALHLEKFWGPGMRAELFAHVDAGGAGLLPAVRDAVARLRVPA